MAASIDQPGAIEIVAASTGKTESSGMAADGHEVDVHGRQADFGKGAAENDGWQPHFFGDGVDGARHPMEDPNGGWMAGRQPLESGGRFFLFYDRADFLDVDL